MTKLHAEVQRLRDTAALALKSAQDYGYYNAVEYLKGQHQAYNQVLDLFKDPAITASRWQRVVCKIFHRKPNLSCPNCGGLA